MMAGGGRSSGLTERPRQSDDAIARRSAITVAVVFALMAAWQWHRGRPLRIEIFAGAAVALVVVALIPPAARRFHRGWMTLAHALGAINSRIILSVLYFLIITPIGRIVRWTGYDPLTRRTPRSDSYWIARPHARQSRSEFEKTY
jgi:hypothetical protein